MHRRKKDDLKWGWYEIKRAVEDCYNKDGHPDDWGVRVLYAEILIKKLYKRLYKLAPKP